MQSVFACYAATDYKVLRIVVFLYKGGRIPGRLRYLLSRRLGGEQLSFFASLMAINAYLLPRGSIYVIAKLNKGSSKKKRFFFVGIFPKPVDLPLLSTFRNKNVNFGQI